MNLNFSNNANQRQLAAWKAMPSEAWHCQKLRFVGVKTIKIVGKKQAKKKKKARSQYLFDMWILLRICRCKTWDTRYKVSGQGQIVTFVNSQNIKNRLPYAQQFFVCYFYFNCEYSLFLVWFCCWLGLSKFVFIAAAVENESSNGLNECVWKIFGIVGNAEI